MGTTSKIEWTDATFNTWHGCTEVSPACDNCYARTWDGRKLYADETHWGLHTGRLMMSEGYWNQPHAWNRKAGRQGRRIKVFCSSMANVFEGHEQTAPSRERLWKLIEATPNLIWQLLTKRPHNIMRMTPAHWRTGFPSNVWAMTTVENQQWFNSRLSWLKSAPAAVLGFSCEPLLGPIDISGLDGIDPKRLWIIAGGESSGSALKCRKTEYVWFAELRDQCLKRGIAFFFKQWGNRHEDGAYCRDKSYRLLDGREWNQFPGQAE